MIACYNGRDMMQTMRITVRFHSYFKELAGCDETAEEVAPGSDVGDLLKALYQRFPKLAPMRNSTLVAVGLEYQDRHYRLKETDEVSLFPPVQGG